METITKEVLLKSDPELRPYQLDSLLSIFLYLKCLVKMFCGTGKSKIITNVLIHSKKNLSVVVFPSLALIRQYSADYLNNEKYAKHFKKHKTMNISSEKLDDIQSTTEPKEIKKFLKLKSPKIILVTYQSYEVLLKCLDGQKIGLVCYDEAHHITSEKTKDLVFNTPYFEKEVFFTATPKNENGITMFDRENPEKNMCGPVAYDYTYLDGLNDNKLNAFEICVDMYTENTNASIYEAMARSILTKGTSRVLTFHSGVNGESNTEVWNFVKEDEFKTAFIKVQKNEFPEKEKDYTKITFMGMDGNTPPKDRETMLKALDNTPDNEIYIISSCETIGEGVDTKKANMCVFADPKSSITKIIQNIGRVVRPNPDCPLSTILIPCWINMENYAAAQGDRVKQDELIREQMRSANGDYVSILNVLAALRQEDPELYEMCLYSNKSDDKNKVGSVSDRETSDDESESDNESLSDSESLSDNESVSDSESEERKGIRLSIHQNADIQMLWGVKGELDFSKKFCSVVIECEVSYGVEKWRLKHAQLIAYMEKENKSPTNKNKNPVVKKLGQWVSDQKKNYAKNIYIMSNPDIRLEWEATLEKYREYLCDNEAQWRLNHAQLLAYINEHKKRPSEDDKNTVIKKLGCWVSTQKTNYKKNAYIMTQPDIRLEWETTLKKYNDYFRDNEEQWRLTKSQLIAYINEHKKRPSEDDKNPVIKKLGCWVSAQKKNYTKNAYIMTQPDIRLEWEATLEKYRDYFRDNEEQWHLTHAHIIAYMDKEKKRPSSSDTKPAIKTLANWVNEQRTNYNKNVKSMSNPDIRAELEITLQKYGDYLCNTYEKWHLNHTQLIAYMDKEKKSPRINNNNPEIKKLGNWVYAQNYNYKKHIHSMTQSDIRAEWEATLQKYREYLKQDILTEVTPSPSVPKKRTKKQAVLPIATASSETSSTTPHHFPPPSAIGVLHKTYLRMRSDTLHEKFKAEPKLWRDYHATRKQTFATYDPASIPANRIIQELEKIQTKRQKVVIDMGCGEASIAHHFIAKNDPRFAFQNYDHQSGGDQHIQEVDISALPLEDASVEIAIMSLALWGTQDNCIQYLKEAYRVLESGGKFYISDSTKKWSPEPLTPENGGEVLRTLLTENGFKIINEDIGLPFCLFVCNKIY